MGSGKFISNINSQTDFDVKQTPIYLNTEHLYSYQTKTDQNTKTNTIRIIGWIKGGNRNSYTSDHEKQYFHKKWSQQ